MLDAQASSLAVGTSFFQGNQGVSNLMEAAVGDLLKAAGSDSEVRIAALDHLAHAVRCQGWNTLFAGHILYYIAQQRAGLAGE
jgi:hypothetical protein